jgi:hypothetical protein
MKPFKPCEISQLEPLLVECCDVHFMRCDGFGDAGNSLTVGEERAWFQPSDENNSYHAPLPIN